MVPFHLLSFLRLNLSPPNASPSASFRRKGFPSAGSFPPTPSLLTSTSLICQNFWEDCRPSLCPCSHPPPSLSFSRDADTRGALEEDAKGTEQGAFLQARHLLVPRTFPLPSKAALAPHVTPPTQNSLAMNSHSSQLCSLRPQGARGRGGPCCSPAAHFSVPGRT